MKAKDWSGKPSFFARRTKKCAPINLEAQLDIKKDGGTDRKEFMMMIKKCLMAALLLGTAGMGAFAQSTVTLDEAIRRGADGISGALPRGTRIAMLNFSSSVEQMTAYIIEELNDALVRKGTLTVVDRQNLAVIRKEISFNDSGEVSNSSAQQIGRMLGAQVIINGSLTKVSGNYRFRVQALEVETAAIKYSASFSIENNALFKNIEGDYTAGERAGAVALNLFFGLGNLCILEEYVGFAVGGVFETIGFVTMATAVAIVSKTETKYRSDGTKYEITNPARASVLLVGVIVYSVGFLSSSIIALAVHKTGSVITAADNPFPFDMALVPAHTEDGLGLRVSYTYSY